MRKTSKKMNVKVSNALSVLQVLMLIVAVAMIFLTGIVGKTDSSDTYSGFDLIFGKVIMTDLIFGELRTVIFEFSVLNLIPYLLIIVGLIVLLLNLVTNSKINLKLEFILFLIFIVSGVMLLFTMEFVVPGEGIKDLLSLFNSELVISEHYDLGIGTISSIVLAFTSSLLSGIKIVSNK